LIERPHEDGAFLFYFSEQETPSRMASKNSDDGKQKAPAARRPQGNFISPSRTNTRNSQAD
jgi:hypothetical protein